jgi:NAD(P)-dependent dehydrogenase (short-subunit alcohol dehydrogenase family)
LELEALDLMDPASIDGFAQRFLASERPLDILINSAGIMAAPRADMNPSLQRTIWGTSSWLLGFGQP